MIKSLIFQPEDRWPASGWLLGVCAGIGARVGIRPWILRTSLLLALYLFPLPVVIAYGALGLLVRVKRMMSGGEAALAGGVWRGGGSDFGDVYAIGDQYHELEARLSSLESEAVSKEADLRRRFREAGL
jgi:phage shock protein PspC (stress-responsive transcriptional regulator)